MRSDLKKRCDKQASHTKYLSGPFESGEIDWDNVKNSSKYKTGHFHTLMGNLKHRKSIRTNFSLKRYFKNVNES